MDISNLHSHRMDYITINRTERYSHGLRWKLGINTNPCIRSRNGKRCVYCGFLHYRDPVSPSKVGEVFNDVFRNSNLSDIHRLELYVSGSFFDDEEVSVNSRLEIIESINESEIDQVLLESRPEFITKERLSPLVDIINPKRITIAIGVETMDDMLRNKLSKGFSTKEFIRSLRTIAQAGMNFQAYLMLNPPAINNDRNAVIDIIDSSKKMIGLAREVDCSLILAVQPFFLAKNSLIAKDRSQRNSVRPPWLYTIALTLRLLSSMRKRDGANWQIILGNENDNVATVRIPSNYTSDGNICSCTDRMRTYLREINISQKKLEYSIHKILNSPCRCRRIWESEVASQIDIYTAKT